MSTTVHPSASGIPALCTHLRRAFRKGAHAAELLTYTPDVIDMVCPGPPETIYERAVRAEHAITAAVEAMEPPRDAIMGTLLCLRPRTMGVALDRRRAQAARAAGVTTETFRRERQHEQVIVLDLALRLGIPRTA